MKGDTEFSELFVRLNWSLLFSYMACMKTSLQFTAYFCLEINFVYIYLVEPLGTDACDKSASSPCWPFHSWGGRVCVCVF